MSDTQMPTAIDPNQLKDALTAFCEVLGISPLAAYFPLVVTEDEIIFPAHPSRAVEGRPERVQLDAEDHPQGVHYGELSVVVRIKVEQ